MIDPELPLSRLIVTYAPADQRAGDRLIWAFDERLAQLVRTTTEPMIGQMRIAWWDEALGDTSGARGRGEPLLGAMRARGVAGVAGLRWMLDGWEALISDGAPDEEAMRAFATGRGEGLFAALARTDDPPESLRAAGRLWCSWDLSAHLRPGPARDLAVTLARTELAAADAADWPKDWKALRLLTALARHDVSRGRASTGWTLRSYARLLRIALVGR
jgi:hypothetical protein